VVGDNYGEDVGLRLPSVCVTVGTQLKWVTWLFVMEEKRNIAEGKDRKNPCAAARK